MQEKNEITIISNLMVDQAARLDEFMLVYEAAVSTVKTKLQILNSEFQCRNDRNPIENVKSRIKSPNSIIDKLIRKGLDPTFQNMVEFVHDIAGIRVICPFISDVYEVSQMLTSQSDIQVVEIKDYIKNPKPNGYRSLHIIITVTVCFSDRIQQVPVELQFRTIAMNFWASLEHQLRYKKQVDFTEQMQDELLECANLMADADGRMQKLANKLPAFFDY